MIENKENGDTETWSDIIFEFERTFRYWCYEFDKQKLSLELVLTIQDLFLDCNDILQCNESERDYVAFSQNIEILRIMCFAQERSHDRVLKEIHNK